MMWRKKSHQPESQPPRSLDRYVNLPVGSCLETENGFYYINKINGSYVRYKIKTKRILDSWNFPYIVHSTETVFKQMKIMGFIGFRPGSLVKDISTGLFYVIDGGTRRRIDNPDILDYMGMSPLDAILASSDEINLHKEGEVIK